MIAPTLLFLATLGAAEPGPPFQMPEADGTAAVPADPDSEGLYAHVHTSRGTIVLALEPRRAPLATASFVGLAEGAIENDAFGPGRPFYDGTTFHRVVDGHVIQAGIPDSDEAEGPGFVYPNEIHADLSHDRAGVLGVANSGPHTNSGQFYITLADRSYLDGDYIVFGEVAEGMDVVRSIVEGDVVDSVRIVRLGDEAEAFRPDTEAFRELVRRAEVRARSHDEARRRAQEGWLARNLPELEGEAGEVRVLRRGGGASAGPGAAIRVRYRGTALRYVGDLLGYTGPSLREMAFGSGPEGTPGRHDPPSAFPFESGSTSINPGLDGVLAGLSPGARVTVVVPPELGYDPTGFYGPDRPGERRFVISPGTMLVYEVEVLQAGSSDF